MTFRPWQNFPPLQLKDLLASNASADEEDVLNVKQRLNASGHYEEPSYGMTRYPDNRLFDGIKSFQRDQGLTVDGYMRPGGETEAALNKAMADRTPHDPLSERQEAIIAFAKKYGMAEDKAREYMTKPSIFKTSGQRSVTAAPQVAENSSQLKNKTQPQTIQDAASAPQKYQQGNAFRAQVSATAEAARRNAYDGPRYSSGVAVDNLRTQYPPKKKSFVVATPATADQPEVLKPEWHEYFNAVMADRAAPRQANAQKNLFASEGGMKTPNKDTTPGGFLPQTRNDLLGLINKTDAELDKHPTRRQALNRLRAAGLTTEDSFKKASPSQVAAAHRAYFDHVLAPAGGFDAIETIRDDHAASALADVMFQHGASGGTLILQRAINQRLKELDESIHLNEDQKMGPNVLTYYNHLVSEQGSRDLLLDQLADERRRYMEENNQPIGPGEETRFNYYRGSRRSH